MSMGPFLSSLVSKFCTDIQILRSSSVLSEYVNQNFVYG
jgi:hypothetical protein